MHNEIVAGHQRLHPAQGSPSRRRPRGWPRRSEPVRRSTALPAQCATVARQAVATGRVNPAAFGNGSFASRRAAPWRWTDSEKTEGRRVSPQRCGRRTPCAAPGRPPLPAYLTPGATSGTSERYGPSGTTPACQDAGIGPRTQDVSRLCLFCRQAWRELKRNFFYTQASRTPCRRRIQPPAAIPARWPSWALRQRRAGGKPPCTTPPRDHAVPG